MECGAKRRDGKPCKAPAMENGRCRIHGGKSPRGVDSGNFKTGLYSKYAPTQIRDKIEYFQDADPLSLIEELALTRALLAEYLIRFEDANLDLYSITAMSDLVLSIGKTVERISKIKNDTALTAAEITYLAARCAEIVTRYIHDPIQQSAFIAELFGAVQREDKRIPEQIEAD